MSRLTITLDDDLHRALKDAAARQKRSIGKLIEESLILRGITRVESAQNIIARARSTAQCNEKDAIRLAVEETRSHRVSG